MNGLNSNFFTINTGTIKGSVIGSKLYAIYVSPLFDLTDLSNLADDNFALTWHTCKQTVKNQMQNKLELITNWLKKSGLKEMKQKPSYACFK